MWTNKEEEKGEGRASTGDWDGRPSRQGEPRLGGSSTYYKAESPYFFRRHAEWRVIFIKKKAQEAQIQTKKQRWDLTGLKKKEEEEEKRPKAPVQEKT